MKNSRFTEAQIMLILKQAEGGVPVSELCREHGMSNASFYKWRAKYGGMDASLIAEMKDLSEQNRRLKKMYAEMSMQNGFVESFNGRLRDECLNEHLFSSYRHARELIESWRKDYNTQRPHTSLKGLTPYEYASKSTMDQNTNTTNL
ncbi:integrase core domain-containing protein [Kiloniella litopenaei]|uniref:integrase core domain-containing protein n=1 Tax=Kiloniella litopenaei TaxID=1549748 RepID=UPI003BAC3D70